MTNVHLKEVIVDTDCGAAVLRGAHIFAPGVVGMLSSKYIYFFGWYAMANLIFQHETLVHCNWWKKIHDKYVHEHISFVDCQKGDQVSIYVDLLKKCKRGLQKIFPELKFLIACGTVLMKRSDLFGVDLNPRYLFSFVMPQLIQ